MYTCTLYYDNDIMWRGYSIFDCKVWEKEASSSTIRSRPTTLLVFHGNVIRAKFCVDKCTVGKMFLFFIYHMYCWMDR